MAAGLMYFKPTDKAKAVLKEWHQVCADAGSNNQPAWNKVCPTCPCVIFWEPVSPCPCSEVPV